MISFNNKSFSIRSIFPALVLILFSLSNSSAADTCIECHKSDKFRIQNKALFDYYNNWKDSIHDIAGVVCKDCHGGDPAKHDKKEAHKNNYTSLTSIDKSSFRQIPARCGECHESVLNYYKKSKHYKALVENETGPLCSTCHGSMNVEVYYTSIVTWTCKECHNEYTGNRPEIVGEADKILHRLNVSRAFKNWVSIYYADSKPEKVSEMNQLYQDVADSWHKFDFAQLDEKSQQLLTSLKSLVNRGLAEKKKKRSK